MILINTNIRHEIACMHRYFDIVSINSTTRHAFWAKGMSQPHIWDVNVDIPNLGI